jgi:hypothetical protein
MMSSDELNTIIERIASGTQTATDVEALRVALSDRSQDLRQLGKYNVNICQGQDIHIGDRTYVTWNDEAIQALIEVVQKLQSTTQTPTPQLASVDELVQQVRSRLHDDIQCLHGTMPLWGVDRWVPLGELFVDVNILEEVSSSRKSELDDLWQDFTTGMQGYSSYCSLERIGLGKQRQRVSGLEVLAKNTNLMVVGKPGSGKTTYLQRVVTQCNAGNLQAHRIPVLIKLREFVEDGREVAYSLERYLEWCWRLSKAETQLVLDRGRALVLLDGLDEVTGEDGKNITKEIKRFARAYPQVQVIVTCRTQNQESRFERFDYVEVADFNEPQVRAFAQHWFKTMMGDESAGLARAQKFLGLLFLEENKPIRELAITPILLSLTCTVFHQTGKFYSKRSKLYEEGLELLLEQWDKSRSIERDEIYRDLSVERKLELLSYLAVKKFEQEQYVLFEQAEIEGYIAEFLGIGSRDSRVVLRAIELQHGLLIERAQKVWSFSHLTFQEYLIANYIVQKHQVKKLVIRHLVEKRWKEIFLLVSALVDDGNDLLEIMGAVASNYTRNPKLQNLLMWANQVTYGSRGAFKLAAKRSAALDLAFALGTVRRSTLNLTPDFLPLYSTTLTNSGFDLFFGLDYECLYDLSCNYALDFSLVSQFAAAEVFNRDIDFTELMNQLKFIENRFPNENYLLETKQEFAECVYQIWLNALHIEKAWLELTELEVEAMTHTLYINELIIKCKEAMTQLSMKDWEKIEERILVPLAK